MTTEDGQTGRRRWAARLARLPAVWPLLAVGVGVLGFLGLRATAPETEARAPQEQVWTVATTPLSLETVQPDLVLYGEVVASRVASLRPLVDGRVIEVNPRFVNGAVLQAGLAVLRIDPFDYEAAVREQAALLTEAQARLSELEADLEAERPLLEVERERIKLRETDLRRRADLRKRGSGTQKAVDDARLALTESRRAVLASEQTIGRLEQRVAQQRAAVQRQRVALERADKDLEDTVLTVPFDGFAADITAAIGQRVTRGDQLGRLIDGDSLEVSVRLPDAAFARLTTGDGPGLIGRPVEVTWRIGRQAIPYRGRIERIGGEIDSATGGVEAFVRLSPDAARATDRAPLRPGAFVELVIPDRRFDGVMRLPETALGIDASDAKSVIYTVADDRLREIPVRVVYDRAGTVLVRPLAGPEPVSEGLPVVKTAFPEIGPGVKVRVVGDPQPTGDLVADTDGTPADAGDAPTADEPDSAR